MSDPIEGIDHVFLMVGDLDAAAGIYRQLGFTVSERGLHSAAKGSANHTIVFGHDYLELLGFVAETPDNAERRATLARDGDGLEGIALKTHDVRAAAAALNERGVSTGAPGDFERPVRLPDGTETRAGFTTVAVASEDAPVGHVFVCGHHTPEVVWRADLMSHENGASGLAALVVRSDDGAAIARRFADLFGVEPVAGFAEGTWRIDTGTIPIEIIDGARHRLRYAEFDRTGSEVTPRVVALRIAVTDLERAAAALRVPFVRAENPVPAVIVSADAASGVILEFVAS